MAKTYRVKEGDNLRELSKKLKVPIAELQSANGIRNLTPGQTIKIPNTKTSAGGYSVSTGEGEHKTINYNGETIRLGPNSTFAPKNESTNAFQNFWNDLTGNKGPSAESSVRGALPNGKGVNGLASPTAYGGGGVNATGQVGGLTYQTGEGQYRDVNGVRMGPNSTYTPKNSPSQGFFQGIQNLLTGNTGYQPSNESSVRGSVNKGVNGMFSPTQANGNPFGGVTSSAGGFTTANQMIGGYANQGYQFLQGQGMLPAIPQVNYPPQAQNPMSTYHAPNQNPVSTYRAPTQFSYAPQGQPNSYTPYNPAGGGNNGAVGEVYNAVQNYKPPLGGGAATVNSLPAQQPAFNQENFQNGSNKGGGAKRWWIKPNAAKAQRIAGMVAPVIDPLSLQSLNQQQTTWRI